MVAADIFYHARLATVANLLLLGTAFSPLVLAVNPPFTVPCGKCPPNEILRQSPPSCEPTCYDDCTYSAASAAVPLVHDPTCVCKPGYVRDGGVCIAKEECYDDGMDDYGIDPPGDMQCSPTEDLLQSPPCCEPTCTNDCSNIVCPLVFIDQPTCVCKTGLVRQNGICIDPRQCVLEALDPALEYPPEYYNPAVAVPVAVPLHYEASNTAPAVYTDVSYIVQPAVCGSGGGAGETTTTAPPLCPVCPACQCQCQQQQQTPAPAPCQQPTPAPCQQQTPAPVTVPPPCPCQGNGVPCMPPPPVAPPTPVAPCNAGCMPPPPMAVPNPCGFCRRTF